jgi:ABC-type uncharacterized transport system substrate-binding protein
VLFRSVKPDASGVTIDVYDPGYFVDYQFVEKDPAKLIDAPSACTLDVKRKADPDAATAAILGQIPASERELPANLKAMTSTGEMANRVVVKCP